MLNASFKTCNSSYGCKNNNNKKKCNNSKDSSNIRKKLYVQIASIWNQLDIL